MISVAEAREIVLAHAEPCGVTAAPLSAALGHTLREELVAARDQPPFRASAMDGYAVRAADTPGVLRLVGEAGAGRALARPLGARECARIFTGAPLPDGADSVLIQEEAARDGALVTTPAVTMGRHVRSAGADFQSGKILLKSGSVLDAASIALAAAAGRASLQVSRQPRVTILSGGDELIAPGGAPAPDQIFDSMGAGVAALAEQWGAEARKIGPLADRAEVIAAAIADAVATSDVTIVVGGASVGDHDHARPAVRRLGGNLLFEKVALRPGKPTWFARVGDRLVLGLPGNPASAFVCARLFLRPLIDRLCARDPGAAMRTIRARTRSPLSANGTRESYLRARLDSDELGQIWVNVAERQDSSLLSVFAEAQSLLVRKPDAPGADTGAIVEVLPHARF